MALTMTASLLVPAETAKAKAISAADLSDPVVSQTAGQTVWDCIYFGNYWQTRFTPVHAPVPPVEDEICMDADGSTYLHRTDDSCYRYEPIKWRVLEISGTDAFLMADKNLDQRSYHHMENTAVVWADCDLRTWLNGTKKDTDFMMQAFTSAERKAIKVTTVKNEADSSSGKNGGPDTKDQVYLLSEQESLNTSYGFDADPNETASRQSSNTDYAAEGGTFQAAGTGANTGYWLRSSGQTGVLCVRPVMHVDLSDTSLWSYAGKVTADGSIFTEPEAAVKAPGKPTIKSVTSTKANTAKVTLSKKVSGASGYQVQYATNSKFTGAKTKKFTATSVTLTGLSNKTYYFRVRAYKKNGSKAVYGKWSSAKKVAVKGASAITCKTSDFSLQLPADWKGKYLTDKSTFDGMPWLAFYEKSCYQELDGNGGWLFSIGVYKDDSYMEMPSYEVIKKKGSKTYVAIFPTDVQFYGASKTAQSTYLKMEKQTGTVLKSFKLL